MAKVGELNAPMPALAQVRPEHSGDFLRLSQLWQRRTHFSLILVGVDSPHYRDALIARLAQLQLASRAELTPDDSPGEWLNQATRANTAGASRLHLCLPLGKPLGQVWWQRANVLRENLADALPGMQVLWLMDADINAAAQHAPDLWNWREAVFMFTAVVAPVAPVLAGKRFVGLSGPTAPAVAERLSAIERYLADSSVDDVASASLRLEAAQAYERLGHWQLSVEHARQAAASFAKLGDALRSAHAKMELASVLGKRGQPGQALDMLRQEVLPVFDRLGDLHSSAAAYLRIADLLEDRGEWQEALTILRQKVLPAFEQLGDLRSRAVTLSQIADALKGRGEVDEALRIQREEVLPIFDRLGDARERALTMGKIADVLQARGELEAAMRIRREEELPVYDKLGDVRSRAVTMGQIAEIVQAQGELDEALRIRREEVLPVLERLGDLRELAASRANLAVNLHGLGRAADRQEIALLLGQSFEAAQYMHLPEAQRIATLYQQIFGHPIAATPEPVD